MADRLRSTTRDRLAMCWSARPVGTDEFGTPIHDNPFRGEYRPGERVISAADNTRSVADVLRRWDVGSRLSRGSIPR